MLLYPFLGKMNWGVGMQGKHAIYTVLVMFIVNLSYANDLSKKLPQLSLEETYYYTIGSMEIIEIDPKTPGNVDFPRQYYTPMSQSVIGTLANVEHIVSVGKEIWKIVEKNKPISNYKTETASIIPEGVKHWSDLESWAMPSVKAYSVRYKNLLGGNVVTFNFKVLFTPKGTYKGVGQFLTNLTIVPSTLTVGWGYTFNAIGKVAKVTNVGSKKNPIAATELHMNWSIKTAFRNDHNTEVFYVRGDGKFKRL